VKLHIVAFLEIQCLHNYFNLVEFFITHLMEEEGATKVGYSLEVHFSNEASRTLKFLPIVVV
jgi:hypothetical protein